MNIIKHLLKKDNEKRYTIDSKDLRYFLQFSYKENVLTISFIHTSLIKEAHTESIITIFSFSTHDTFIDIFDNIKLKDLLDYKFIKNLKESNYDKLFSRHIEKLSDYNFCKLFLTQFDPDFLKSIKHYQLTKLATSNIILFLTSYSNFNYNIWKELKVACFLIKENNLSIEDFFNIEDNIKLNIIFKHKLVDKIIMENNFKDFLNQLNEEAAFDILKQSNQNFHDLKDANIKNKFLMTNIDQFRLKNIPTLHSPILQEFFIFELIHDKHCIFDIINNTENKVFYSHTLLNIISFLEEFNTYDYKKLEFSFDIKERNHSKIYKLIQNEDKFNLIFNNIEIIKFNLYNLVYLLSKYDLIDYNSLDSDLNTHINKIITEKELQYF